MPQLHKKIAVIMPLLKEEKYLPQLINGLPRHMIYDIIAVDNGCPDRTAEAAHLNGCRVIKEPVVGYGRACRAGIRALDPLTDIVVFLDGDYRYVPEQMEQVFEPILSGACECVLGSRMRGQRDEGVMPRFVYLGIKLACTVMFLFWGAWYSDVSSFRAVKYGALKRLDLMSDGTDWLAEMQIQVRRARLKTREIPVTYRWPLGQKGRAEKFFPSLMRGTSVLATLFRLRFGGRKGKA